MKETDSQAASHELTGQVIGLAMKVHRSLGTGFLEAVYRNALCIELVEAGLDFETEQDLAVSYRGKLVGTYRADLIVRGHLLVEIKAVLSLLPAHEAQVVNYLAATGFDLGLLLNFGSASLTFKRKHRAPKPSAPLSLRSLHSPTPHPAPSC